MASSAELLSRRQHFPVVGSTNDVVRDWLRAGTLEVCLAVADEQTAGRGREGRRWQAPPGAALLLSLGFRPGYLEPGTIWQLAAIVSMAMADAAEALAGLGDGTIRLKWPNDLVVEGARSDRGRRPAKLAGVLGESEGLGTDDPRVVVGIGVNVDWHPDDFPADLAAGMTSLREAAHGDRLDRMTLLDAFLGRLEPRIDALRAGAFGADEWAERQLTTGRLVELELRDGTSQTRRAVGVDPGSGALLVADDDAVDSPRGILSGEVRHVHVRPVAVGV
jgi:BirA family biotin operon repressor/biotin-[acetyl-CoA-carboxylase] ligase